MKRVVALLMSSASLLTLNMAHAEFSLDSRYVDNDKDLIADIQPTKQNLLIQVR
ncbi:hypothetical protein [Reinekea sp.]|jgi:phosphonate transport system substrate-binding protein|uniref:hypothetical protein n=1 Tax=Reinekea sp. TaxID=1970455 RepID=UPI00398A092C